MRVIWMMVRMPDASIADEMRYGVIAQSSGSRPRRQPRLASSRGGVMMPPIIASMCWRPISSVTMSAGFASGP